MSTALPLVLASASPRRQQMLREAGIPFVCHPADIVETALPNEAPAAHVERLAAAKAAAIAPRYPQQLVLGADTIVYLDGQIIGKPRDLADARRMIEWLNGRTHHVYTGVCLRRETPPAGAVWHCITAVTFRRLDAAAITRYLREADCLDKAGAYALQDHEDLLIAGYDGPRSNVVGLPLESVRERLPTLAGAAG